MSENTQADDKNFEPTESRIARARQKGDVAQSREANAAAAYLGLYVVFLGVGPMMLEIAGRLSALLNRPEDYAAALLNGGDQSATLMLAVLAATAAFLATPGLGALLSLIAQQAITIAPEKLAMKVSRLSVIANAKHKFGPEGIGEFAKGTLKLTLIMAAFAWLFLEGLDRWPIYARAPSSAALELIKRETVVFLGLICLFSVLVASIDLPWQRSRYRKKLMMSLEELKRESKESDGDPAMKQSRRQRAKAIATNRMLLDVPTANVVIVNPTHYAVAIKWNGPGGTAPICVAKGVDEMAAKIREIAERAGVPQRSDPPTARAIHSLVEVGDEIQRSHYAAVAAAIIFADRMRARGHRDEAD